MSCRRLILPGNWRCPSSNGTHGLSGVGKGKDMSWVTNVVLFYGVGEEYIDMAEADEEEDIQYIGTSPCLMHINAWLTLHGWVELVDMTKGVGGMDRHSFETNVWGAALNHLDIGAFLECVKGQAWQEPENVQVMVQAQDDERFTLYSLCDIGGTQSETRSA